MQNFLPFRKGTISNVILSLFFIIVLITGAFQNVLAQCVSPVVPEFVVSCPGTVVKITATGGVGDGYGWYDNQVGGSAIATVKTLDFTVPATRDTIWVSAPGCTTPRSRIIIIGGTVNRYRWDGSNSTNWLTAANWECPTFSPYFSNTYDEAIRHNVYIPAVISNYPTISNTADTAQIYGNIFLESGASLTIDGEKVNVGSVTINPGATLTIKNGGSLTLRNGERFISYATSTVSIEGGTLTVNGYTYTEGNVNTSSGGTFVFGASASHAGPTGSFINGRVAKTFTSNGNFVFPLGKGTIYRPAQLNVVGVGTPTTFEMEYLVGNGSVSETIFNDPNVDPNDRILHVSSIESWDFVRTAGDGGASNVTLNWGPGSGLDSDADIEFLRVVQLKANGWNNINSGTPTTTGNASDGTITSNGELVQQGLITLGSISDNVSLPVSFTKFSATRANLGIQLDWTTSKEINNKGFEIQRSADGFKTFDAVAFVNGFGNTSDAQSYSFTDTKAATGPLFYRLKQIDYNGNSEFSEIKYVNGGESITVANGTIFPNPTPGNVTVVLDGLELGKVTSFTIVGADGRVRGKRDNVAIGQLDSALSELLASLNNGTFTILLKTKQRLIHIQVVKI